MLTRRSTPAPRALRHFAALLVALLLVVPLVGGLGTTPPVARGDNLSEARARQAALAQKVAAEKKRIAQLSAQQAVLSGVIDDTNTALKAVNADLTVVKGKIATLAKRIAAVKAAYADLVAQLAELDAQLVDITGQEADKADELAQRKAVLAGRLRAAYTTDRTSVLEMLLSSGSFADALTNMGYLLDFGKADEELAARIVDDQQTLATLHQAVSDTRDDTNALREQTAATKKKLDASLSAQTASKKRYAALQAETSRQLAIQKTNWAKLAKNKAAAQRAMEEAAAAERALSKKIAALIAAARQKGNIPSKYNGTLAWPMAGTITQEFGCTGFGWEPRYGNCSHYHQGIDVASPMYTPVRAAGDGRVVFAGANPYDRSPQAWIVIVAHSSALQTWYAHLDNRSHGITVKAGEWVTKGQIIGYEGMTGRTTGPHLHFMVELDGAFVNPRLFM